MECEEINKTIDNVSAIFIISLLGKRFGFVFGFNAEPKNSHALNVWFQATI